MAVDMSAEITDQNEQLERITLKVFYEGMIKRFKEK